MTSSEDLALLNIDVVNDEAPPPFYISEAEKRDLRTKGEQLVPALVINPLVGTFDDFIPQMMIPPIVMDLARKAKGLRLTTAEIEAIREIIRPGSGLLRQILELKIKGFHKIPPDASHPPYIRVACTGIGDYDGLVPKGPNDDESGHEGTYGSPAVLEIWPAQHFSPIHSHGGTTGIMYCLAGEIDVMSYQSLGWDAKKVGLVRLTPGQCAWLAGDRYAVHKVYCPMDGGLGNVGHPKGPLLNKSGEFAATFHVYLNPSETLPASDPDPKTRDIFDFVEEQAPHDRKPFTTYSDLSWRLLRKVLAQVSAELQF